jgi:hypothetical protein
MKSFCIDPRLAVMLIIKTYEIQGKKLPNFWEEVAKSVAKQTCLNIFIKTQI